MGPTTHQSLTEQTSHWHYWWSCLWTQHNTELEHLNHLLKTLTRETKQLIRKAKCLLVHGVLESKQRPWDVSLQKAAVHCQCHRTDTTLADGERCSTPNSALLVAVVCKYYLHGKTTESSEQDEKPMEHQTDPHQTDNECCSLIPRIFCILERK